MNSSRINNIVLAGAIALALLTTSVFAQNETGVRYMNKTNFQLWHFWYDSSTARFHTRYPIIRSLPPLNSGMPWDILAAYVYMDSLARFDRTNLADATLDRWQNEGTMTDTLKGMVKYLYKLADYDPAIFRQYLDEIGLKQGKRYWENLSGVVANISITLYDVLPKTEPKVAMLALLETSYILRVKILSIDSMPAGYLHSGTHQFYHATASVLDTLKGQRFLSCLNDNGTKNIRIDRTTTSSSDGCIQFVYLHNLYFDPNVLSSGEPQLYSSRDPEFAVGPDSSFEMKPGQEAVVFISHQDRLEDSSADYYHLRLENRASFGALPIIDGKVRDINHIWSDDVLVDYAEWRNRFMAIRQKLLSGTY